MNSLVHEPAVVPMRVRTARLLSGLHRYIGGLTPPRRLGLRFAALSVCPTRAKRPGPRSGAPIPDISVRWRPNPCPGYVSPMYRWRPGLARRGL